MANTQFDQLFVESGRKYGVDPAVLKAIASVESSFRPNIRGPRTKYGQAQGMMQFIPATAKAYGLDDPFDPAKSVDAAARLLRDNLKMFKGDVGKALEAYNGGPRLVGKSKATAEYRDKVLQRAQYANFGASPTQVAQKPAPKTPISARPSPPARVGGERVGLSALSTLPMNYQAAIALQYLTDTDPEGNPEEQAEQALRDLEKAETQEAPAGPTLAQAMASQEMPSPFEHLRRRRQDREQRTMPSMASIAGFAGGGYVIGGTRLAGAPMGKDLKAERMLKQMQAIGKQYNESLPAYNAEAERYGKLVDAYNADLERWNAGPRDTDFSDFTVPAPVAPTLPFTEEQFQKVSSDVGRKRRDWERAFDVRQDPGAYNLAGFGFKKGGEVQSDDFEGLATQMTFGTLPSYAKDSKAVKDGLKESGRDIVRGIKLFPADLIGAPVDIANLVLTPFGLGSDKPVMGSDYLIDKLVEAGIYEKPSGSGVETLTRMAGLPASTLRGAMRAMQKGEEALGQGMDVARGKFPETAPEGIVRPFGGASSVARVDQDHGLSMQHGMYYAMKDMQTMPFENKQAQDAAMHMIDVKARKWFNEQAGTANDPLKQKLYAGKITFADPNDKAFPSHLLEAARKGKGPSRESAQIDLEDRYDHMIGVRRLVPESTDPSLNAQQRDQLFQAAAIEDNQNILRQLRDNPDLIPDQYLLTVFKNKDPNKVSDADHLKEVRSKLREAPEVFSARVEPFLRKLITRPAEVITKNTMEASPDRYGEVAREAAKRGETFTFGDRDSVISPRGFYKYDFGGPIFFNYTLRDYAGIAPAIPGKELEKMSFPDFIERGTALLKKKAEAQDLSKTAKKMLSQDITREMPSEIMFRGISKSPSVTAAPTGPTPPALGPVKSLGWHKLEDPESAEIIAKTMDNSVGNYADYGTYGGREKGRKALETGEAEIYVLYDDKLRPHMTAEVIKDPKKNNAYSVHQITGNGPLTKNNPPSAYLTDAVENFRSWVTGRNTPVTKARGGLVSMQQIHNWV